MACGEHELELIIGNVGVVFVVGRRGRALDRHPDLILLRGKVALAAQTVDGFVPRSRDEPRRRLVRDAGLGPGLESARQGVLERVLGAVEISELADEGGQHASRVISKDACRSLPQSTASLHS